MGGLGFSSGFVDYGVLQTPPTLPASVHVGDTGHFGTVTRWTDSTKATANGTIDTNYSIWSDTASTAVVCFDSLMYDASNAPTHSLYECYRMTSTGALSLIYGRSHNFSSGNDLVMTAVGDSAITATATTTAQSLTVDTAMTSFTPLSASGGATPYTYSHTGTLPTGLSLDASTGAVTGTPTDSYPTASIVFSVKDANNVVASTTSTVSFTVAAAAILPAGYVSQGGLTWMPVTIQDTWANANAYCANTTINGQTGWRMPTQTELSALYAAYPDNSGVGSGNSTLIGQGWSLGVTWSATLYSAGSHYGFYLPNGNFDWYNDTGTLYVSCVQSSGTASATTIASMPYNGSVAGADHGYYVYTTVGTVSTISASALSADIDPEIYTDATFTALNSNWTCTAYTGTSADSCTATTPVSAGTALFIKAHNYAGTSTTFIFTTGAGSILPAGYVIQGGLTWMPVTFQDTWTNANDYCANTTINGQPGWRMPTQTELSALYASGTMMSLQGATISFPTWSSTPVPPLLTGIHYYFDLDMGLDGGGVDGNPLYVSCVR